MEESLLISWVTKVTTEFYELVYKDPWFSKIFRNIQQEIITSQQIDFMVGCLGGPKRFGGRVPKDAHPQIWVDENIWKYREDLLIQSFKNVGAPQELMEKWLKIDEAFKHAIINKGGVETCKGRYLTDEIIYEPMPEYLKKKAA
ncbi:MAG: hypothetical protein KDD34_02465 [Bdellovibrionales bacterium]|nr:hypothetical protein [Bdellovibrionales bacterium]